MLNQNILNIRIKNNWDKPRSFFIFDKYFFIILSLGILNILFEYLIRLIIPLKINDVFIQFSHIVLFFLYPSYLILHSLKKSILFCSCLFFIIIPLYILIKLDVISYYYSSLFSICWLIYIFFFYKEKDFFKKVFLGSGKWKNNLLLGLVAGIFFSIHILLVALLSDSFDLNNFSIRNIYLNFFLEFNFSLLGMEFFFRYLMFYRLIERNGFSFFISGILSTILLILPFYANPGFNNSIAIIIAVAYYGLMQGLISCWLVYKTKSLLPSLIFGLVLTFFLSFIF